MTQLMLAVAAVLFLISLGGGVIYNDWWKD